MILVNEIIFSSTFDIYLNKLDVEVKKYHFNNAFYSTGAADPGYHAHLVK